MKRRSLWLLLALLFALQSSTARPQRTMPPPKQPDEEFLETQIGEMLAAWQLGDFGMMKNYYADDVTVVSGEWEPPLVGWNNYVQAYMRQRDRLQRVRLDRHNTLIRTVGNFAWATYQWDFEAFVDGRANAGRGHTTLLFQKRDTRWLIVHNHTSLIGEMQMEKLQGAPQPPAPKPGT
jgi:ketosteroid isomerase-like protein